MEHSYWARRSSRRGVLRATGLGTAGIAAVLIGCGSSSNSKAGPTNSKAATTAATSGAGQAKRGGIFLGGLGNEVPHLDVHAGNWPIGQLAALFHAQLLQYMPDASDRNKFQVVPYLASAMPEQPDDTTYIFKLRPNIKFHNVAPVNARQVTADDVIWNLNRVGAKGVAPPADAYFTVRTRYNVIDTMEAIDPLTVKIKTKAPVAPFLAYLADMHPSIAPKELGEKDLQNCRVGCGPFLFADWQRDVSSTFKRNPDFFMPGHPLLDEVHWTIVKDEPARWAAFKSGQIYDDGVPTNAVPDAQSDKGINLVSYGITDPLYMALNALPSAKPLDDVRVRRAAAMAINHQEMVDKVFLGRAKPSGIIPWSMGDWALPPDQLPYDKYDPAEAKKLLQAAGAEGAKINFITTKGYAPEDDSAALAVSQLKQAGFDVQTPHFEYSIWLDHLTKNDFGAYTVWASPQVDPDGIFQSFVTTANSRNYGTTALDAKIAKQRSTLDRTARLQLVKEIQRDIADQAWRVGLPNWNQYDAQTTFLRDYNPAPVWYATARWMWNTWLNK